MKVRAIVDMVGCDFEEWQIFFDSYQAERSRFVKNETVIQTGDKSAEVVFEILDIDGLTELSKRPDIMDFEAQHSVTVDIQAE